MLHAQILGRALCTTKNQQVRIPRHVHLPILAPLRSRQRTILPGPMIRQLSGRQARRHDSRQGVGPAEPTTRQPSVRRARRCDDLIAVKPSGAKARRPDNRQAVRSENPTTRRLSVTLVASPAVRYFLISGCFCKGFCLVFLLYPPLQ